MTWNGVTLDETGWALLTPSNNISLTTITQLGAYTIDQLAAVNIVSGYVSSTGTSWADA